MEDKQPDSSKLLNKIDMTLPLIGFYDAPDSALFEPLVTPKPGDCIFTFFQDWLNGKTLHINREHYGCGGAGHWMCGIESRPKEGFIKFLVEDEGLKESPELMEKWLEVSHPYTARFGQMFIGPLRDDQWSFIKSVTFFVNPDQLSVLMLGAQYHSSPQDPSPVIAPFGSGCMELLPFEDSNIPQAAISATDIAMRQHLPADILGFVVTPSMFQRLCRLDEKSFLYKPFLKRLRKARGRPG
jgi:hypothetical protein